MVDHSLQTRRRRVVVARCSLASVAQYVNYPHILKCTRDNHPESGRGRRGEHALLRCYDTKDGSLLVVKFIPTLLGDAELSQTLRRVMEHFGVTSVEELELRLSVQHTRDACTRFRECCVDAVPLADIHTLRENHIVPYPLLDGSSHQFLNWKDHPIGCLTITAPVSVRMTGVRLVYGHAPKYGEDTREVLRLLGEDEALHMRVASCSWSKNYIPFSSKCDVCLAVVARVSLSCNHKTCEGCLARNEGCGVCAVRCASDVRKLRQTVRTWADGYQSWRRGNAKGAQDLNLDPPRLQKRSISL